MTFLAVLTLFLGAAVAEPAPELPAWAAPYGLTAKDGVWRYARKRPNSYQIIERALTEAETRALAQAFEGLDSKEAAALVEKREREFLAKTDLAPRDCLWFEPAGDGKLKLSDLGKNAGPGVLLGDPAGDFANRPAPELPGSALVPRLKLDQAQAALGGLNELSADPSTAFDGTGRDRAPLTFYAGWGLSPNAVARGRNIESVYGLYSVGSQRALNSVLGPAERGPAGVGARLTKALVLDIPVGLMGSFWQHELGHFDLAYMAGAKDVAWVHEDNANFLGILGATTVSPADWERMTPDQRLAFNVSGIASTQASAEDMRRRFLSESKVDWWHLPLWAFEKMDATVYALITPPRGGNGAFDTVQWRDNYAARRGVSVAKQQAHLAAGAVWNMLDPTLIWATYSYFHDYVWQGKERLPNPMPSVGGVQLMPGTGFWLSELGPQYRASLLGRHAPSGNTGSAAVTAGDGGQLTVEAAAETVLPGGAHRARLGGALWSQREAAEPGANSLGGALTAGLDIAATKTLFLVLDAGAKTHGALLGRSTGASPWFEGGVKGSF